MLSANAWTFNELRADEKKPLATGGQPAQGQGAARSGYRTAIASIALLAIITGSVFAILAATGVFDAQSPPSDVGSGLEYSSGSGPV